MSTPITRNEAILELIISQVPPQDIPILMGVCKRWARIIRGPTICSILFQHYFPRLTCDRRTVCAEWQKQRQIYANIKAQRFTHSSRELTREAHDYVFMRDWTFLMYSGRVEATHIFKEFILSVLQGLAIFNKKGQLLRTFYDLFFLGIEEERIICWSSKTGTIVLIDEHFNQNIQNIHCSSLPVLWGPFLYYYERRGMKEIIQIDRRDGKRKQICSESPVGGSMSTIGSLLYCPCFDRPKCWVKVIDMQTGTLVGEVDGIAVGDDRNRFFTQNHDNVLQAYNTRSEPEQTYRGIERKPLPGARVTSFNCCTVYTAREGVDSCSTYIWCTQTGQLLATFPYLFLREDQGKLYFLERPRKLIICDFTQSDPM